MGLETHELAACHGPGNSRSGEEGAVRRPDQPEFTADLAWSVAVPGSSLGSVEEAFGPCLWQSPTVFAALTEKAAMTSSGTAQDTATAALERISSVIATAAAEGRGGGGASGAQWGAAPI
jgi:hypothetical protein